MVAKMRSRAAVAKQGGGCRTERAYCTEQCTLAVDPCSIFEYG